MTEIVDNSAYYLVLLETSGNQNFIFSTNKLKENIGASELTYQSGSKWILEAVAKINKIEAVAKINKISPLSVCKDSKRLRQILCSEQYNPPIEKTECKAEIIIATSGKSLILTKEEETAKQIISDVTKKALIEAPGLDIAGVFVTIEEWNRDNSLADGIRRVHQCFEKERSRRPFPESRFLRLPVVADCAVSGLPAAKLERNPEKQLVPISKVSEVKRDASNKAMERLQTLDTRLMRDINKLEKLFEREETPWLAIVHADGNGLGQIFLNFEHYIGDDKSNRAYIHKYRKFSLELDECTEEAFKNAIDVLRLKKDNLPLVPLIVGGDDLTVVCDGHYALEFTRVFLQEFETQTQTKSHIAEVAEKAFKVKRLSACAGISIVKRHFPFSVAYELAESLIKSAKEVKRKVLTPDSTDKKQTPFPCSAIDFHILYDTSGIEFETIRKKLEPDSKTLLYNRPYIVTDTDNLSSAKGKDWAKQHEWKRLNKRVVLLNRKDSEDRDRPSISSSQSHAIRTSLFVGQKEADAQYALIRQRYNLDDLAESEESLFYEATREKDDRTEAIYITSFLDALDAQEFLKNEQTNSSQQ